MECYGKLRIKFNNTDDVEVVTRTVANFIGLEFNLFPFHTSQTEGTVVSDMTGVGRQLTLDCNATPACAVVRP